MNKRFFLRLFACLLLVLILASALSCGDNDPSKNEGKPDLVEESFSELLDFLTHYSSYPLPEDFDPSDLTRKEIVAATKDPYAAYFTNEEYAAYSSDLGGNLVGIGVTVALYDEADLTGIHVLSVYPDSPAAAAGLAPRDVITKVDGTVVTAENYDACIDAVRGESGTSLTLTYVRDGVEGDVTLTRASCVKSTVHHRIIKAGDTSVGYVYISAFDTITTTQFISAVSSLEAAGVTRFIFDLRSNRGGYLNTVCEMLAYVLPDGDICSVDYGYEELEDYSVYSKGDKLHGSGNNKLPDGSPLPVSHSMENAEIAVLVDKYTASAAELFTSALRDYNATGKMNATVWGNVTYGKGSMQSTYALANGDYLKMTVALYNPPSGVNYNGIGITPTHLYTVHVSEAPVFVRFFGSVEDISRVDRVFSDALAGFAGTNP